MLKKIILLSVSLVSAFVCSSCEPERDFGFPSRIEISGRGESIGIKGNNDLPPSIFQFELLDYDGNGNNSVPATENKDCIETTTDWLTVRYLSAEYKLVLIAEPNETRRKRKLYLYLYDGRSRQEITIIQSKQ